MGASRLKDKIGGSEGGACSPACCARAGQPACSTATALMPRAHLHSAAIRCARDRHLFHALMGQHRPHSHHHLHVCGLLSSDALLVHVIGSIGRRHAPCGAPAPCTDLHPAGATRIVLHGVCLTSGNLLCWMWLFTRLSFVSKGVLCHTPPCPPHLLDWQRSGPGVLADSHSQDQETIQS